MTKEWIEEMECSVSGCSESAKHCLLEDDYYCNKCKTELIKFAGRESKLSEQDFKIISHESKE